MSPSTQAAAERYPPKGLGFRDRSTGPASKDPCACSAQRVIAAFFVLKEKQREERGKQEAGRRGGSKEQGANRATGISHHRQLFERAGRDTVGVSCRARLQGETPEHPSTVLQLVLLRRTGATVREPQSSLFVGDAPPSSHCYLPGRSYECGCHPFIGSTQTLPVMYNSLVRVVSPPSAFCFASLRTGPGSDDATHGGNRSRGHDTSERDAEDDSERRGPIASVSDIPKARANACSPKRAVGSNPSKTAKKKQKSKKSVQLFAVVVGVF